MRGYLDEATINPLLKRAVSYLVWINLFWGILNLFPIWPLDGGQISRDLLDWILRANGIRVSLGISIVVAEVLPFIPLLHSYPHDRAAPIRMMPLPHPTY